MNFRVTASPHAHDSLTTPRIMGDVLIALIPACAWAVYAYGWRAGVILLLSIATAVGTEALIEKLTHKPITVLDLSAAVTGALLALNLPASAPLWLPVVGSAVAIAVVKMCFGGLGHNFMNPALAARTILMVSWPAYMSGAAYTAPTFWKGVDAVASATPLSGGSYTLMQLFLGQTGGCIGEVSALALIIGFVYLLIRRIISWRIPVVYTFVVFVMTFLFHDYSLYAATSGILSGGLLLGAIFMATDYTTSPMTAWGQIVYALGCGLLTFVIRFFGSYPEGVSFSILLMNVATPLIDRAIPTPFGVKKGGNHGK